MTMQSTLHNDICAEDESEKLCPKCGEYWPPTSEFFPVSSDGKPRSPCKCCIDERRQEMAATKPCCIPGCTNPRYYWRYARCWEHRAYLQVNPQPRAYRRKATNGSFA